eukprot:COSAG06_NODE_3925_length_4760_cov_17.392620_3_plen_257_part_00
MLRFAQGTGEAQCPTPHYTGGISATCDTGAGAWSVVKGGCRQALCPAAWLDVLIANNNNNNDADDDAGDGDKTADGRLHLRLPQQERSDSPYGPASTTDATKLQNDQRWDGVQKWDAVPCCSNWSNTGSCLDHGAAAVSSGGGGGGSDSSSSSSNSSSSSGGGGGGGGGGSMSYGFIVSGCDSSGHRQLVGAETGCHSVDQLVTGVRLDQPKQAAEALYAKFAGAVGDAVHKGSLEQWVLPSVGAMSTVSLQDTEN